jgi:membrane protease YdiL (CAAX protease family)
MLRLFWNPAERRLRFFWRLLATILLWLAVAFGLRAALAIAESLVPFPWQIALSMVAWFAATLGVYALASRLFDRRTLAEAGMGLGREWWFDFAFGLFLGGVSVAAAVVVGFHAGWLQAGGPPHFDSPFRFDLSLAEAALLFVCVGSNEEIAFRGYLMRNLAEAACFRWLGPQGAILLAIAISSVGFGLVHLQNPHSTHLAIANTVLAGIWLGLGYAWTGRLGLPIGLHIAWNFAQGPLFGLPVSGNSFAQSLFGLQAAGPEFWTGGGYGLEGGMLGTLATVFGCLAMAAWLRARRGRWALERSIAEFPRRTEPLVEVVLAEEHAG